MSIGELLTPRGDATTALATQRHNAYAIDVETGTGGAVWSNADRSIWAAAIDPSSSRIAVLSSSSSSVDAWEIAFIELGDLVTTTIEIGIGEHDSDHQPDAVAGGRGGLAWMPDSSSIAVALPTGGLLQVYPDGSQVRLARASIAKRPAAVAVSAGGSELAYVDQPSGSEGSGIYAGSLKAKPIDPVVVLAADRSGNRYARGVGWVGRSGRVATIIERGELGTPQGDLFYVDTHTGRPELAWTSPAGRDVSSVESFAISADGNVVAFLTNSSRSSGKPSSTWMMQTDGSAIERFDLPVELGEPRLNFTRVGMVVSGLVKQNGNDEGMVMSFVLEPNGAVTALYIEPIPATPEASPVASPLASPVASPLASPEASSSPRPITNGE